MKKDNVTEYLNSDFSKQYIANGLANIPGGFFVYKAHGNKELLYANHDLLKIFECETAEEFIKLTGGTFDIDKLTGLPGMRSFVESSELMLHPSDKNPESFKQTLIF